VQQNVGDASQRLRAQKGTQAHRYAQEDRLQPGEGVEEGRGGVDWLLLLAGGLGGGNAGTGGAEACGDHDEGKHSKVNVGDEGDGRGTPRGSSQEGGWSEGREEEEEEDRDGEHLGAELQTVAGRFKGCGC
jgi:hypothetical protein